MQEAFETHNAKLDRVDLEDWLYGIACVDFDVTPFLDVLNKPQYELRKIELVLSDLQHVKTKPNGDVKLSHRYLPAKQYAPIQAWVDAAISGQ